MVRYDGMNKALQPVARPGTRVFPNKNKTPKHGNRQYGSEWIIDVSMDARCPVSMKTSKVVIAVSCVPVERISRPVRTSILTDFASP
jgi:hypothetical protein